MVFLFSRLFSLIYFGTASDAKNVLGMSRVSAVLRKDNKRVLDKSI